MRALKRIAIALLVAALAQAPFIYRRQQLARLRAEIDRLAAERHPATDTTFKDYRGVIHVHSWLGGHSSGTFEQIVRAARANALDFIIMTEHPARYVSTAEATLKGFQDGVLFINGNEVKTADGDRLLVFPSDASADDAEKMKTAEFIARARSKGVTTVVAYPDESHAWQETEFDGMEVYNLYTDARRWRMSLLVFDALWSWQSYPDLIFTRLKSRPTEVLKRWDEAQRRRATFATAGNDAHANIGIGLFYSSGKPLFEIKFDPYEVSFRLVRNHVLIERAERFDQTSLLSAIARGHCYIAFDLFSDPTGFLFSAESDGKRWIMGDALALDERPVLLRAQTPLPARILLLKDGAVIKEMRHTNLLEHQANEAGAYRVEVYLEDLPLIAEKPWIISNHIRLTHAR